MSRYRRPLWGFQRAQHDRGDDLVPLESSLSDRARAALPIPRNRRAEHSIHVPEILGGIATDPLQRVCVPREFFSRGVVVQGFESVECREIGADLYQLHGVGGWCRCG
mmetsp:Transcript_29941/g.34447  ORF Transcript_29941/g.34447 Transcript_29941/m.34447 type:complete len:108 (+) Transcript_29941:954-1277(+)